MGLHRLSSVTLGVPDVDATYAYYRRFGLGPGTSDGWLTTSDGGDQMRLVRTPRRQLVEVAIGADNADDIAKRTHALQALGFDVDTSGGDLITGVPGAGLRVRVSVADRIERPATAATPYNGPGRVERANNRAPGLLRTGEVEVHKLGHVVLATPHLDAARAVFERALGFQVSDEIRDVGVFLRCSTDHHNVFLINAPVTFLHHTSWEVDDVDEVGRGAMRLLSEDSECHMWGPGRHFIGSNFFWYLRDPAGNYCEYYADMDEIADDAQWVPRMFEPGPQSLFQWGPEPPPTFLEPADLA